MSIIKMWSRRLRAAEEYVVSIARFDVDIRTLRDVSGKLFGEEMYRVAQSEQINEVLYTAPNFASPGDQVKKGFYIARVGNFGCGVGYHR